MSKNNCPLLQQIKTDVNQRLKIKLSFKRARCHSMVSNWSSDELLKITPNPYIYFPDYNFLIRDYENDFLNFSRIINLTKETNFTFYKCRDGDSQSRNMMVIFASSQYDTFYKNLQKLDKLKVFL